MFQDDEFFSICTFAVAAYLFYMWLGDFNYFRKNKVARKGAFEGATTVSVGYCVAAAVAGAMLLTSHILTEYSCGVVGAQTSFSAWAIFSWIGAAFVEELIFRGYLVVKNRGWLVLVLSILGFSIVFAAGHPFLWNYEVAEGASIFDGVWKWNFAVQPLLSTIAIFECSILFYALRFLPQNKYRSILPCVIAHLTYNCGVFVAKLAQGFIS